MSCRIHAISIVALQSLVERLEYGRHDMPLEFIRFDLTECNAVLVECQRTDRVVRYVVVVVFVVFVFVVVVFVVVLKRQINRETPRRDTYARWRAACDAAAMDHGIFSWCCGAFSLGG